MPSRDYSRWNVFFSYKDANYPHWWFFLLSMLVVATSGSGFVLGSGSAIDFAGLCCTCAGTMMVAASANSLNQVHN